MVSAIPDEMASVTTVDKESVSMRLSVNCSTLSALTNATLPGARDERSLCKADVEQAATRTAIRRAQSQRMR